MADQGAKSVVRGSCGPCCSSMNRHHAEVCHTVCMPPSLNTPPPPPAPQPDRPSKHSRPYPQHPQHSRPYHQHKTLGSRPFLSTQPTTGTNAATCAPHMAHRRCCGALHCSKTANSTLLYHSTYGLLCKQVSYNIVLEKRWLSTHGVLSYGRISRAQLRAAPAHLSALTLCRRVFKLSKVCAISSVSSMSNTSTSLEVCRTRAMTGSRLAVTVYPQ
jgi:hypothetical protein